MTKYSPPNINTIPEYGELVSINQQRAVRVIIPAKTSLSFGKRAAEDGVKRWIERLSSENLVLTSDVEIEGPFFCPFLDHYGEDMWLGVAHFTSTRPRRVKPEVILAARETVQDAGLSASEVNKMRAIPSDALSQLQFVRDNPDLALRQLQEVERNKNG